MEPFTCHTGVAVPLPRSNVDTDQIIPKQFLKRIERTGFGQFAFFDWRFDAHGTPRPDFELNLDRYRGASVLVAGTNFGCGSSREHAVWALHDYGIRTVIAPSFADIFFNNCLSNGLLPVTLPEGRVAELTRRAQTEYGYQVTVDLERCEVSDAQGFHEPFEIDASTRDRLLHGLDDIGLTLQYESAIDAYEREFAGA